ncbi:hypothetical protein AMK59_2235 [Oryctes borbonicus]|uniref:Uncharacterized protein n=1 Tax=Oryctes borbonicus TaxID=1629725 RepID=A0A0T6B9M7_9SCAR|nr:hypothetical protein AMK59_2235 [Oryctes borbonicus]
MTLHRHDGNTITMQVHIPPNAQVGIWHCSVQTCIVGRFDRREEFKCEDDIYILFNPWCRDDGVYVDRDDERNEYVMNENGKIWLGTYKHPKGKRWIFGQFHETVLPACIFLLDKSGLPYSDWNSPVLVTRAISEVVSVGEGEGLLEGRWDGDYSDGTSPHAWTGSIAILDQYLRSGGTPVKYTLSIYDQLYLRP